MSIYLVAGGARSGKSRKGEELARTLAGSGKPVLLLRPKQLMMR